MTKKTERLSSIIRREMADCVGLPNGALSKARLELKGAYFGDAYPADSERSRAGWSTHVDRSVLETVEWAKGPLLKVFSGTDELIKYEPLGPEQEQIARDATDYVNNEILGKNAFDLVYGPITDALYQRVGWAKVYFESVTEKRLALELAGLSHEEAKAKSADVALSEDAGFSAEVARAEDGTYTANVYLARKKESIKVEPIPSERVIFSKDAVSIEKARFIAHWEDRLAGELLADGYSKSLVESLPGGFVSYPERDAQDSLNSSTVSGGEENKSDGSRTIRVYEAYLTADAKGDGTTERYKVTYAGGNDSVVIMDVEEWHMQRPPLFAACSAPIPYSVVGLCLADLVLDLQKVRTEMFREMLDGMYLSNHGELHVNRDQGASINMDQLLARKAGGVYFTEGNVTIEPLAVGGVPQIAIAGLEVTEKTKEQRTGIGMSNQGLSADVLQNTATGAAILEEAQNIRLELIARVIAETFYKPMAKYVLCLAVKNMRGPVTIRRKGNFAAVNPAEWDADMDVSVSVGLGTGSRKKRAESVFSVINLQKEVLALFGDASPVRAKELHAACAKYVESLGMEAPEQYIGTVEAWEEAERNKIAAGSGQGADPEAAKLEQQRLVAEQKMALERAKADAHIQNEAAKIQAGIELKQAELAQKGMLSQEQMQLEAELDAVKMATGLPDLGATIVKGVNTL